MATQDDALVYHAQHEAALAGLDSQERAMLAYARKLNDTPAQIGAADIQALREAGFSQREILDVALVVCLFNFMNRLADGLGVQLDEPLLRKKQRADERMRAVLAADAGTAR